MHLDGELIVHVVEGLVAIAVAFIGLKVSNSTLKVTNVCDRIDAKIDKHVAVDEVLHEDFKRRLQKLEE